MIEPRLHSEEDIAPFLELHILKDLEHISISCGESVDNCILLLHDVLNNMKLGKVQKMETTAYTHIHLDEKEYLNYRN